MRIYTRNPFDPGRKRKALPLAPGQRQEHLSHHHHRFQYRHQGIIHDDDDDIATKEAVISSTLPGGDGCPDINGTVYTSPEAVNRTSLNINLPRQVAAQSFMQLYITDFSWATTRACMISTSYSAGPSSSVCVLALFGTRSTWRVG